MQRINRPVAFSAAGLFWRAAMEEKNPKKDPVHHNWITNLYDKLNIPVWVLDVLLVFLCAVVVFCFIYGANVQ